MGHSLSGDNYEDTGDIVCLHSDVVAFKSRIRSSQWRG